MADFLKEQKKLSKTNKFNYSSVHDANGRERAQNDGKNRWIGIQKKKKFKIKIFLTPSNLRTIIEKMKTKSSA